MGGVYRERGKEIRGKTPCAEKDKILPKLDIYQLNVQ
jgi:hypothetical protein